MTTADRPKAMIGQREVRPGHLPGWLLFEGTPVKGEVPWHMVKPSEGYCGCKSFETCKVKPKTCKHLRQIEPELQKAQVFADAGVLA